VQDASTGHSPSLFWEYPKIIFAAAGFPSRMHPRLFLVPSFRTNIWRKYLENFLAGAGASEFNRRE
jgi:hypothetical protein